jgi:hypothetical protein
MHPDHPTRDEQLAVAYGQMKAAEQSFHTASNQLEICQSETKDPSAQKLIAARLAWSEAATVYSEALANYGNLLQGD